MWARSDASQLQYNGKGEHCQLGTGIHKGFKEGIKLVHFRDQIMVSTAELYRAGGRVI